jgi:hypothetical protein
MMRSLSTISGIAVLLLVGMHTNVVAQKAIKSKKSGPAASSGGLATTPKKRVGSQGEDSRGLWQINVPPKKKKE